MKGYTLVYLFDCTMERVLLQTRVKEPYLGKLNGCGGKLELGETPCNGAIRELSEETGYAPEQFGPLTYMGMRYSNGLPIWVYTCSLSSNEAPKGKPESLPLRWLDAHKVVKLPRSMFAPHVQLEVFEAKGMLQRPLRLKA